MGQAARGTAARAGNTRHSTPVSDHNTAPPVGGAQRPNLKSEDSGLRTCFSGAKVSLWMCENGTGLEEARGPTRR